MRIFSRERRHGAREILAAVSLCFALVPAASFAATCRGRVLDAKSGNPIAGALATMGNTVVQTDAHGAFRISGPGDTAGIRADGYLRTEIPLTSCTSSKAVVKLAPFRPKALYLSFYSIGTPSISKKAGQLIYKTELYKTSGHYELFRNDMFLIAVEDEEFKQAETAGGYASEMSEDFKRRQAELIASRVGDADAIITTALIPGRPAPVLITPAMVESIKPGSVIVDLAVESGGNCPLSKLDEVVEHRGVSIVGFADLPSQLATDASNLYARNLHAFLTPMLSDDGLKLDVEDEIVAASLIAHQGEFRKPELLKGGQSCTT